MDGLTGSLAKQIVAPIHLLPTLGGHLDRWRGGSSKGMNQPGVYTHLESLLLFETVLKEGVDGPAWVRISDRLINNVLIKGDETFDAARLKPDLLQGLFFRTLQQELWGDAGQADDVASPGGSRKRKLDGAPTMTIKDLADNIDKMPMVIDRLWERYRANKVKQIRDDEQAYDQIQLELRLLEKNESERMKALANQNSQGSQQPALAPKEIKPAPPSGMTPSPRPPNVATPAAAKRAPTSTTPVAPPRPPGSTATPAGHATPPVRPAVAAQGSGLQAPAGAGQQQPTRVLQAPSATPKVPISPRPEAANKPRDGAAPQATPSSQSNLKWEKPYQPPGPPQVPGRQTQSPVPQKATTPQQYAQNQQQWQQQQSQNSQQGQAIAPQQPQTQPPTAQGKPGQPPPQSTGHVVPQIQPGPPRPTGTVPGAAQQRPQSKTPVPPPHRPIQPQQHPAAQQPRPIASASPTPPGSAGGLAAPPQRWPSGHIPQGQRSSHSASPGPIGGQRDKPFTSPYGAQPPRPAIPEHMIRHAAAGTPSVRRQSATASLPPSTPTQISPASLVRGFGTKWAPQSTPSTPGPLNDEPVSPAYEPVSPPQRPASLARSTTMPTVPRQSDPTQLRSLPLTRKKMERMKKLREAAGTPSSDSRRRSESVTSGADELSMDHPDTVPKVKDEALTPRPHEEAGDTTADESVHGRGGLATPGSVSRLLKRKRQDTPLEPPGPPSQVLWTRGFTKVSSSALDQISSHRDGNMFATAVRERDAPNYRQVVLQPQDITSIRSAIKQGNKAAVQAANSLPGGDPGTTSVWLPMSEDLCPPKGIINSAQLERELVHMFCNAIMYNPDPERGLGSAFTKRSQQEEEEVFGYRLDEYGVVRNTQSMFVEVEKLLGDLRSAEKDRTGPPPGSTPRPGSVATPADDTAEEEDELAADGDTSMSGTVKRRRTAMRT